MGGSLMTSRDKYVSQMKQEVVGSIGTSYEPLLERHIGRKVVIEVVKNEGVSKYRGILKEYTSEFIELMDVDYRGRPDDASRPADILVPRKYGIVRHFSE